MEFLIFNRIFKNFNAKYTFYQKLCQTTFIDLIETNNFANLRFFYISHIIVNKWNFGFSILFF